MNGAKEFAELFGCSQQIGRLYLVVDEHARGSTFRIFVLPDGLEVTNGRPWIYPNVVEVYGITGGNPGWTETYGWIDYGPWQDDFSAIVVQAKRERENCIASVKSSLQEKRESDQQTRLALLSTYKRGDYCV